MQLAPPALHQLPSPIQPDQQQERRLQILRRACHALVPAPQTEKEGFHGWVDSHLSQDVRVGPKSFGVLRLALSLRGRPRFPLPFSARTFLPGPSGRRPAKPTQRRPILKPLPHRAGAFFHQTSALSESHFNRLSQRLALPERAKNLEFSPFDPPEIYGIVHP